LTLKPLTIVLAALVFTLLVGCAAIKQAGDPSTIVQPESRPIHNLTSFSLSLSCMDTLFVDYGVRDIVITSQGIPDATGEIRVGTKEMLISAISRMSTRSGAFRFVDYDQRQIDINALQNLVGFTEDFLVPNYYIRGAITQFDEQVLSQSASGGMSVEDFDIGAGGNKVTSLVSIDLNMGNLLTRQILPGTSANNTIAVSRSGRSADMNGAINMIDLGFSFNVSLNRSEGMHQSVRTLLELSTIETLGKLTAVPYWHCLGAGNTSTAMIEQARGWFYTMSDDQQRLFVQRALSGLGLYNGPIETDVASSELSQAVGAYQASQGLLADGKINFQLYLTLIGDNLALGEAPEAASLAKVQHVISPIENPLDLFLTTPRGEQAKYKVGDTLSITLRVSEDAFAYCYYQDGANKVVRLFPNRYQPNALVAANSPFTIPGVKAQFEIVLERSGITEEVLCLASREELGIDLPERLKGKDLVPLSVDSLDGIATAFSNLGEAKAVDQRLAFKVYL
jgi:curli biogenesis system outer membrane secretion channel CsgG